jgi:hypothetical protein
LFEFQQVRDERPDRVSKVVDADATNVRAASAEPVLARVIAGPPLGELPERSPSEIRPLFGAVLLVPMLKAIAKDAHITRYRFR